MSLGQQSSAYAVGQVSGSLVQQNSRPSESLSELFRTAIPTPSPLLQPVSKVVQKSTERDEQHKRSLEVNVDVKQKKNMHLKKTSVTEQELLTRENGLLKADKDEYRHERSLKKRRTLETSRENNTEHWVMKRQRLKANRQEEALKLKRTVFVGNLPISCTMKVREDPSMSRKEATIKRKVHPKRQSVNAYVVFKNEEGVANALERNGMEIDKGFIIRVDRVTDYSSHDHKRSVFVGNLPFDIKELAFRRHFEKCGKVEAVRLVRDPYSGLGKGFGYILFESADSVEMALALDGSKLESRSIRVKRSLKLKKKNNSKKIPWNSSHNMWQLSRGVEKPGKGNHKSGPNNFSLFKGEMADPSKKTKKALKKRKERCI